MTNCLIKKLLLAVHKILLVAHKITPKNETFNVWGK